MNDDLHPRSISESHAPVLNVYYIPPATCLISYLSSFPFVWGVVVVRLNENYFSRISRHCTLIIMYVYT